MKHNFEEPAIRVEKFSVEDVVTVSMNIRLDDDETAVQAINGVAIESA